MRKQIGVFVAACLYYSGLVGLARWWRRRAGPHLVILNYHRASGGNLRRHLLYLRRHYRLLPLEAALEELYGRSASQRPVSDRRMPLALTFDDGYRDNYTHALALARELQVPITIFLIPGYIQSGDYFWWGEGRRLASPGPAINGGPTVDPPFMAGSPQAVDKVMIEGCIYHLNQPGEGRILGKVIDTHLRHARSVAEREAFLKTARKTLAGFSSVDVEDEATLPLTWAEIRDMQASGWVSFGAHTMHHPILAYLTDPAEVRREVGECRTVLEQQLGHPVRVFAYPVGQPEHIGNEALRAVHEAGYDWAVTTIGGTNTPQTDPYLLRRVLGEVNRHWLVMAAETCGIWNFFSPLWKNAIISFFIGSGEER